MTMRIALAALTLLAACSDPALNVGLTLGSGGVSVRPSVSAGLEGGGRVSISP